MSMKRLGNIIFHTETKYCIQGDPKRWYKTLGIARGHLVEHLLPLQFFSFSYLSEIGGEKYQLINVVQVE